MNVNRYHSMPVYLFYECLTIKGVHFVFNGIFFAFRIGEQKIVKAFSQKNKSGPATFFYVDYFHYPHLKD